MRFSLILAFLVWNIALIFFGAPSTDHQNYANWWIKGYNRLSFIEPAFSIVGLLFSSIISDYRLFFVIINVILFSLIVVRIRGFVLGLLILVHPFTVFGLGNTILGFSAGLFYLAFLGQRLRFLSLSIHKGTAFLVLSEYRWLMFLSAVVLMVIPHELVPNILSRFEVNFSDFLVAFVYAFLPLLISSLVSQRNLFDDLFFVAAIFIFLCAVWFVIPKAADRAVNLLYLISLLKTSQRFSHLHLSNRLIFASFYVLYAAVGFVHPSVRANMFL